MRYDEAKKIFSSLYTHVDGYKLSHAARSKLDYNYIGLTYGEIDFHSFYSLLSDLPIPENSIFYDLGAGTGKAVITAALGFPFKKCIGVEILEDLFEASQKVASQLKDSRIQFFKEDFIQHDFHDADILFINAYSYMRYDLYNQVFIEKLSKLKKGARIITSKEPMLLPFLTYQQIGPITFSWADEYVFINTKI